MTTLLHDLRYGWRMLARNPGFTAVAVLTLALGIGLNATIFTAYNAMALRPLSAEDPASLVRVFRWFQDGSGGYLFSYPEYTYYRDRSSGFSALLADSCCFYSVIGAKGSDRPGVAGRRGAVAAAESVGVRLVSGNYFSALGANFVLGRAFLPGEDQMSGASPVVVLSYEFWQRHFASEREILGNTLMLNGSRFTVVGVVARDFVGTASPPVVPDVWVPITRQAQINAGNDWLGDQSQYHVRVIGRLKPGTSLKQAQGEMTVLAGRFTQANPEPQRTKTVRLAPATYFDAAQETPFVVVVSLVMAAVGMVLLIACANVANLLVARAVGRQKEIAVRLALGASRARLVRQMLTESLLLGVMGGSVGLLLSVWTSDAIWAFAQRAIQEAMGLLLVVRLSPDIRVLGYTLSLAILTGVLFGLAPALKASRPNLTAALKDEGGRPGWRSRRGNLKVAFGEVLIIAQVAACLVLLIASGLLMRGLLNADAISPGFETRRVVVVMFGDLRRSGYDEAETLMLRRQILERLGAVPGVKSVGLISYIPLLDHADTKITMQGRNSLANGLSSQVAYDAVSADYFRALGIPIIRGRSFTPQEVEAGMPVLVISESAARRFWPNENPIGKRFVTDRSESSSEVIGVAKDVRNIQLSQVDPAFLYFPLTPTEPMTAGLVQTAVDPKTVLPVLRETLEGVDENLGAVRMKAFDEVVGWQKLPAEVGTMLAVTLGLLALVLASVGIYGVMAFAVGQRRREIGIRMALGAERSDVLRLMLQQGLRLTALGVALGLIGSAVVSPLLSVLLFGLSPLDPVAFVGISVFLVAVALLACYIPARRATKVDPMVALRYE